MTIPAPHLLQAAAYAAGAQQYPAATLYVVATPIGNLADLTLRAIHVLAIVDVVACEDTRGSGMLMRHLGLDKRLFALHEHNEVHAAQRVCTLLAAGQRVAYISDAGTPAISDPGALLVAAVAGAGFCVVPIPGASSAAAALSVAGDTVGKGFTFTGFLPPKGAARQAAVQSAADDPRTQVLFEAPHRIESLVQALAQAAPRRKTTLCRELTKQFETIVTRSAGELPAWLAEDPNRQRGEFVLVVHAQAAPAGPAQAVSAEAQRTLAVLLRDLPLKQAVALSAELSGEARNALYEAALALRGGANAP